MRILTAHVIRVATSRHVMLERAHWEKFLNTWWVAIALTLLVVSSSSLFLKNGQWPPLFSGFITFYDKSLPIFKNGPILNVNWKFAIFFKKISLLVRDQISQILQCGMFANAINKLGKRKLVCINSFKIFCSQKALRSHRVTKPNLSK